jgi:hypothetical protein
MQNQLQRMFLHPWSRFFRNNRFYRLHANGLFQKYKSFETALCIFEEIPPICKISLKACRFWSNRVLMGILNPVSVLSIFDWQGLP